MRGSGYDCGYGPRPLGLPVAGAVAASTAEPAGRAGTSRTGVVVAVTCAGLAVGASALLWPFVSPAIRRHCLPYLPATDKQIENILSACRRVKASHIVDLGSGDGRICIQAAKEGFQATGYELNRWLVYFSRYWALREGVRSRTTFKVADLWKTDLAGFDPVVIFGVQEMMGDLEAKLKAELRPGTYVVACRFPLPSTATLEEFGEGIDTVWVYRL